MKNISYYIFGIVVFGIGLVSFWIYNKYFKVEQTSMLSFQVVKGDLREAVSVRGEVVPQKEFELEFPFGGTVEKVFTTEGSVVKIKDPLMKLETDELDAEYGRLNAVLSEQKAVLAKLIGGAQLEEIRISESKVASAKQALSDSETTLVDSVRSAFTQADDALHNKADQFFDNPRSSSPNFKQTITNTQLKINLEAERYRVELSLDGWGKKLPQDTSYASLDGENAQAHLADMKAFLLDLATAINSISPSGSISQTTLDTWKASILSARTTIDTAITTVATAQEKVSTAASALALAESELAFTTSKPRTEDVVIAESRIDQTKHVLEALNDKILKSTLRAPGSGVVKKLMLEEHEIFKPGIAAVLFASSGYKVQSDVSELDISKVHPEDGNEALIRFDAFPGQTFKGKVVFVEPKEVIKNEDIYFRTDILLDPQDKVAIRSGMSADVVLYGIKKTNVLMIPALAIEKKGEISFVKVARGATTKEEVDTATIVEQEVTTGISDGELVEVRSGLTEGDIVVVSSQ